MALAEPALRQFGFSKLRNLRFRGSGFLGSAVGAAIGIGSYLLKDYDVVFPWNPMLQPDRGRRAVIGPSSQNGRTYLDYQTLRTFSKYRRKFRSYNKHRDRRQCCCPCNG